MDQPKPQKSPTGPQPFQCDTTNFSWKQLSFFWLLSQLHALDNILQPMD